MRNSITKCLLFFFAMLFAVTVFAKPAIFRDLQDSAITMQIKSSLAADPLTKAQQIHVSTSHRYVTLSGMVDSGAEAQTAKQIAQSVPGVKGVSTRDLLLKHSRAPNLDYYITQDIKQRLYANRLIDNPRFPDLDIQVETRNRNVYLRGNIIYPWQGERAVAIARDTDGVKNVYQKFSIRDEYYNNY